MSVLVIGAGVLGGSIAASLVSAKRGVYVVSRNKPLLPPTLRTPSLLTHYPIGAAPQDLVAVVTNILSEKSNEIEMVLDLTYTDSPHGTLDEIGSQHLFDAMKNDGELFLGICDAIKHWASKNPWPTFFLEYLSGVAFLPDAATPVYSLTKRTRLTIFELDPFQSVPSELTRIGVLPGFFESNLSNRVIGAQKESERRSQLIGRLSQSSATLHENCSLIHYILSHKSSAVQLNQKVVHAVDDDWHHVLEGKVKLGSGARTINRRKSQAE